MPTVHDALAALASFEGVAEASPGPDPDARLTGAAPDRDAQPGEVGWLSEVALADAHRVRRFGGTLLVLPAGATERPPCAFVRAHAPRLVFSRLVATLFAEQAETAWPHAPAWVAPSASVHPSARLAPGVVVGDGATIGENVRVGPNTVLAHCTVGAGATIGPNVAIGTDGFGYTRNEVGVLVPFPHLGCVVIEEGVTIGANTCVDRGALGETRIGARTRIDNLVHIAHNVRIGADCAVIAHAMIAGGVVIGDGAWVAPSAAVRNQRAVGAGAVVGMGAVVVRDVPPGATVAGNPARPLSPPTP